MKVEDRKSRLLGLTFVVMLLVAALTLAACGSSDDSTSSGGETATGETESTGTGSGTVDPNKTYAPGVPTLEELREKGSETQPPTSGPAAKPGVSAIFVSCGLESPGCRIPAEEGKSAAAALGWDYKIIDGKNSTDGWIEGWRSAIAAKPDVIIANGMGCPEIVEPLKEAKAAGIETVGLEGLPCNEPLYGEPDADPGYTVPMIYNENAKTGEEFFYQWGAIEAQWLINATAGEAKVILTPYAPAFGKTMLEAWKTELAKCSGCEILTEVSWVNTEQANGFTAKFETALVQYPEANSVLFNYDSTAVNAGGAKAIVDAGRAGEIQANCGEGGAEAQELVRNEQGVTACAAAIDLKWLAWAGFDAANRQLQGAEQAPQGVGFRVIDKTNLSPPGKGVESPVDFVAAYEKVWKG